MVKKMREPENNADKLEKELEEAILSGEARTLIEIGGKPIKLPKKIRKGVKESYHRLHRR